ncbi:TetR/AcrR family transcriptional regulator [Roseateles violae]|uniref:Helix-turn-helix domain-containing protein n=1 Tax=Roseateles violae TaxID=3058042 RepID=A0ABT8DZ89_9BURK|nr:TetR/AcrR family transcriptional regulator [Pelomonas sp. PFR6]MDN3922912.1 helix-turn-helix domain-containing protein [Pelomonas sp. PFR6]
MQTEDHRQRVAAERRERMRARLMASAMKLVATKGPGALSIDDVISAAQVSRGSFYKYFPSAEALVRELAVDIANELIKMAEPAVQRYDDPAERVSCGMRLVARLALEHPLAASFLVQLGWPDVRGPAVLLNFVERDLSEGLRRGRFTTMPIALALNIVAGTVIGAANCMLKPDCQNDFAEQSAAAALRALGLDAAEARRISRLRLKPVEIGAQGLLSDVLTAQLDP